MLKLKTFQNNTNQIQSQIMEPGRRIDHTQNVNAMKYDTFNQTGKTSTKITHPPGGECHFSLGWTVSEGDAKKHSCKKRFEDQKY